LAAGDLKRKQIARALFVSEKTASVHVSNIMGKFGAANRSEAAAIAHRLRLLEPNLDTQRSPRAGVVPAPERSCPVHADLPCSDLAGDDGVSDRHSGASVEPGRSKTQS
jgi:hypothetical protein